MTDSKHIVIDARNRRSSTGRYADRLVEHLQTLNTPHRFTILVQPDDPWKLRGMNFEVQPSPFPQFSLNPMNEFKFANQLRALKADLVHFTMTQQPLTYRGDVVTTTHDLTMLRFVRAGKTPMPVFWLKKFGYRVLFLVAHKKSKHIIVPSKFVKNDLISLYPFTANKIDVTYESSELPMTDKPTPLENISKPFIMHVGSPFPHKNLDRLIEAFEIVQKSKPELQLVLAGRKEHYFEELEAWAKQRPSYKSIHFTGFVEDSKLKWLYDNAEAYVWPSLSEGFGLPGLEAMAHGTPLISSNVTCMPEIYGNAAHYFNPEDITEMARAILEVLDNPKLKQKLIKSGRQQIKKYSWKTMAEETLEIYNKILDT